MAKPNYSYQKRQKELAKAKKQEEKARRKDERRRQAGREPDQGQAETPEEPAAE